MDKTILGIYLISLLFILIYALEIPSALSDTDIVNFDKYDDQLDKEWNEFKELDFIKHQLLDLKG